MDETLEDIDQKLKDGFKKVHQEVKDFQDALKKQNDAQIAFMKELKERQEMVMNKVEEDN